ncbi:MoaD/ThiS family protein [Halobellus salinisoli]|uniref:MoaD/ThiS family protein n=1 Tax=Halobellus salinisoli TaxID=3108500 RepID=UPI003008D694
MAQSQTVQQRVQTTVEVRATGRVRDALGTPKLTYTFGGDTLREFGESFFADYDVRDLVIAETESESESTTRGWAPIDAADVPGRLRKNPDGEQTRAYARVLVNGQFNENLDGFDTKLQDGDRVALVNPFMFCL